MTADIGSAAPDFTLRATTGEEVSLSQYKGTSAVTLVFIPFAFTGVCQGELCAIRDDLGPFERAGSQVLAISCDTAPAQKLWAEQQGYEFPLLSDFWPHGQVAKAYGAFNDERGCANRVTVVIGRDGTIVDRFETENLGTARTTDRYVEALAKV
jgi:peroxiredoxin